MMDPTFYVPLADDEIASYELGTDSHARRSLRPPSGEKEVTSKNDKNCFKRVFGYLRV